MAYVFPTTDDFTERFPDLVAESGLDEDQIHVLLSETARSIDTTWLEGDYANAIMFLTAHYLQSSIDAAMGDGGGSKIASESIGGIFSVAYARSQSKDSPYEDTAYGVRYKQLLKVNHPAVLVI